MGGKTSPGSVTVYGPAVPETIRRESWSIAATVSFLVASDVCLSTRGSVLSAFDSFPATHRVKTSTTASRKVFRMVIRLSRHSPGQGKRVSCWRCQVLTITTIESCSMLQREPVQCPLYRRFSFVQRRVAFFLSYSFLSCPSVTPLFKQLKSL
jgi:hypothetical protein